MFDVGYTLLSELQEDCEKAVNFLTSRIKELDREIENKNLVLKVIKGEKFVLKNTLARLRNNERVEVQNEEKRWRNEIRQGGSYVRTNSKDVCKSNLSALAAKYSNYKSQIKDKTERIEALRQRNNSLRLKVSENSYPQTNKRNKSQGTNN